jgi:2-haloacid dehalogenase
VAVQDADLNKLLEGRLEQVQNLWRTRQLEYTWLRTLMGKWVDFDEVTEDALDFALSSFGIENSEVRKKLLNIYNEPMVFEDVIPFFEKNRNRRLMIASNGTRKLLTYSVERTGLSHSIEHIFSADDVKVYKVSPRYYQQIIDYESTAKDDIIFFSSNAWDISGASSFGFRTVWVNRVGGVFENMGEYPDHEIRTLNDFSF